MKPEIVSAGDFEGQHLVLGLIPTRKDPESLFGAVGPPAKVCEFSLFLLGDFRPDAE